MLRERILSICFCPPSLSLLLFLLLLPPPPSPLLLSILSFRVLRSQRQAHPLKEDDRLEDTQAPANGFVLLASIGIKRKPPSKLQQFVSATTTLWEGRASGKISGHGYVKSPVTMHRGNKYRRMFRIRAIVSHRRRRTREKR